VYVWTFPFLLAGSLACTVSLQPETDFPGRFPSPIVFSTPNEIRRETPEATFLGGFH